MLVKGSMLASVVYLDSPGNPGKPFANTNLYLDTPILLAALGYHGPEAESSMSETLDLAYSMGARLASFDDTISETRSVLQGCAGKTILRGMGRVERYFRSVGYRSSDIRADCQST